MGLEEAGKQFYHWTGYWYWYYFSFFNIYYLKSILVTNTAWPILNLLLSSCENDILNVRRFLYINKSCIKQMIGEIDHNLAARTYLISSEKENKKKRKLTASN